MVSSWLAVVSNCQQLVSSWSAVPSIQKFRKKSRKAKANRHVVERRQLRHLQTHALFILFQPVYSCSAFCLCDAFRGLHFIIFHYNSRHTCKQSSASSAAIVVAAPLSVVWTARLCTLKVRKYGSQLFVAPTSIERRSVSKVDVPAAGCSNAPLLTSTKESGTCPQSVGKSLYHRMTPQTGNHELGVGGVPKDALWEDRHLARYFMKQPVASVMQRR